MAYLDERGLKIFAEKINQRINDIVAKGLHSCASCGAPYSGKPICEYCGRGFFVDINMYKERSIANDTRNEL